jgi:hypothetical protein
MSERRGGGARRGEGSGAREKDDERKGREKGGSDGGRTRSD